MSFRFFRRIRVLPNLWMNLSRGGVSWSVGVRGLRATLGRTGTRLTAGLPGTGLSVSRHLPKAKSTTKAPLNEVGRRLLEKALRGE